MPSSQATEPGSRSGGGPAGGVGDLAEEAVGGPGGEVSAEGDAPPSWSGVHD
jgi:hypothetical protein